MAFLRSLSAAESGIAASLQRSVPYGFISGQWVAWFLLRSDIWQSASKSHGDRSPPLIRFFGQFSLLNFYLSLSPYYHKKEGRQKCHLLFADSFFARVFFYFPHSPLHALLTGFYRLRKKKTLISRSFSQEISFYCRIQCPHIKERPTLRVPRHENVLSQCSDPERIHTEEKRSGCDVRRGGRPKRRPDRDTSGAVPEYPPVPDGRTVPDYRSAGDRAWLLFLYYISLFLRFVKQSFSCFLKASAIRNICSIANEVRGAIDFCCNHYCVVGIIISKQRRKRSFDFVKQKWFSRYYRRKQFIAILATKRPPIRKCFLVWNSCHYLKNTICSSILRRMCQEFIMGAGIQLFWFWTPERRY